MLWSTVSYAGYFTSYNFEIVPTNVPLVKVTYGLPDGSKVGPIPWAGHMIFAEGSGKPQLKLYQVLICCWLYFVFPY
jgi:hypothetical protein